MAHRRLFLREFAPYRQHIVVAMVATLAASLLDGLSFALVIPFLRSLFGEAALPAQGTRLEIWLEWAIGPLLRPGSPHEAIRNVVMIILGAMILKNALAYVAGYLSAFVQEGLVRDLRSCVFRHMQTQGLAYFRRARSGQLISRVLHDAEHVKEAVEALMTTLLQAATLIAVYLIILFSLSWQLTGVALALTALFPVVIRPVLSRLRAHARNQAHQRGELTGIMAEAIAGVRLIKAYGAEEYEAGRFDEAAGRYRRQAMRARSTALLTQPVAETFGAVLTVVMLVMGTTLALATPGALPPAALVAFLVVALRLMSPLKKLAQLPATLAGALVSAGRLLDVLDRPREETDPPTAKPIVVFRDCIVYEGVWFAYDDERWVLQDIDLTARRGGVIALVGASGAGKSTLVDLLPRFYDPTRGRILIDGVPTTGLRRDDLRRLFGIVSQDTVLFNDSASGNIAYGVRRPDPEAVVAAARAANAHDFIRALPQGYATVLGERGSRLSAGERQRLAIARALFKNPPILILDEATSNLDTESERLVQEALGRLFVGRTVFVIAHRLWTITHASEILVLDRGRVVEQGCHRDLVDRGGVYARLHALQFDAQSEVEQSAAPSGATVWDAPRDRSALA